MGYGGNAPTARGAGRRTTAENGMTTATVSAVRSGSGRQAGRQRQHEMLDELQGRSLLGGS